MTYLFLRQLHTVLAILTLAGFTLRCFWMLTASDRLMRPAARIVPHIVDTVLLFSGIAMLLLISLNPFKEDWLLAKFAGLILYVLLGTVAIRRGPTLQIRALAFIAAVMTFMYIVGVALSKSPASWIAVFG